jgi:hypothetical protein
MEVEHMPDCPLNSSCSSELDVMAFRLFAVRNPNRAGRPNAETDAEAAFTDAAAFLRVRERINAGKAAAK